MTSMQALLVVLVLLVIAAVGVGVWYLTRRRGLQRRFGPEYDRVVEDSDSRLAAERELRERERRHAELELRELDPQAREHYTTEWQRIQADFVSDPNTSVREADDLVTRLIADRGYPVGDHDERLAHLSVEHARTLGQYREAHEISQLNGRGEATTEQLRQAVVHYRVLFAELLETAGVESGHRDVEPDQGVAERSEVVPDARADHGDPRPGRQADRSTDRPAQV